MVWFALLPDLIPGVVSAVSVVLYLLFFKFAKDDLKLLRDDAASGDPAVVPVIRTTSCALSSPPARSSLPT